MNAIFQHRFDNLTGYKMVDTGRVWFIGLLKEKMIIPVYRKDDKCNCGRTRFEHNIIYPTKIDPTMI